MATRIYVVFENGKAVGLVRTTSPADAIRHCTQERYEAIVADQNALVQYVGEGMVVQDPPPKKPKTDGAAAAAPATQANPT